MRFFPTCIGLIAPLLWALPAILLTEVQDVPKFEVLSMIFFFSFLATAALVILTKDQSIPKLGLNDWLMGIVGVTCNQIFYVLAIIYAPTDQAVLIYYLWPVLLILLTSWLDNTGISIGALFGVFMAFVGLSLLVIYNWDPPSKGSKIYFGYLYAFLAALWWGIYTYYSRKNKSNSPYLLGLSGGVAALFCLFVHDRLEPLWVLTMNQFLLLAFFGSGVVALSLFCWEFGIKNGNSQLLSIASFGTPLLTVYLLIWQGKAHYHPSLIIASVLIVLSCIAGEKSGKADRLTS